MIVYLNMQVITTTQLRTHSKNLVDTLKRGKSVDLIHRSEVVGEVRPKQEKGGVFNAREFVKKIKALNLPKLTDKEIEIRYRNAMMKKHGRYLS